MQQSFKLQYRQKLNRPLARLACETTKFWRETSSIVIQSQLKRFHKELCIAVLNYELVDDWQLPWLFITWL